MAEKQEDLESLTTGADSESKSKTTANESSNDMAANMLSVRARDLDSVGRVGSKEQKEKEEGRCHYCQDVA